MKISVIPIVFMFLASALIIPVGISYATYDNSPAFVPPAPTPAPAPTNQTNTNMTMTTPPANQTKTNMTMTAPPANHTNTNMTMTTPPANQTKTNMTMTTPPTPANQTNTNMTTPAPAPTTPVNAPKPSHPLTPLEQVKSGVAAKDVQCQSGFSLVLKASDGSPACVHSSDVQILIQRGWAAIQ